MSPKSTRSLLGFIITHCVKLRQSAISSLSVFLREKTDRQTDRHTDTQTNVG